MAKYTLAFFNRTRLEENGHPITPNLSNPAAVRDYILGNTLAETADKLESQGLDAWAETDELQNNIDYLAKAFHTDDLPARQRSRSKRTRRHDTLNEVIRREEISTGKHPEQLTDPEVYPTHRPVPVPRPSLATLPPINHHSACTGPDEPVYRQLLGVPSIEQEQRTPIEFPDDWRDVLPYNPPLDGTLLPHIDPTTPPFTPIKRRPFCLPNYIRHPSSATPEYKEAIRPLLLSLK